LQSLFPFVHNTENCNLPENVAHIRLPQPAGATLINLETATLIVNALYLGREILVPVALAVQSAAAAGKTDALSMSKFFALDLSDSSLFCVCFVDNPSGAKSTMLYDACARRAGSTDHGGAARH
jgi:hypothetical protein